MKKHVRTLKSAQLCVVRASMWTSRLAARIIEITLSCTGTKLMAVEGSGFSYQPGAVHLHQRIFVLCTGNLNDPKNVLNRAVRKMRRKN